MRRAAVPVAVRTVVRHPLPCANDGQWPGDERALCWEVCITRESKQDFKGYVECSMGCVK